MYSVRNIYGLTGKKSITVSVPGSKSITARALLIAAAAEGESVLHGAQFSDDCQTFLNCLKSLGVGCEVNGTTVKVRGCGGRLNTESGEINVGSAGTAARFLPAFLAFQSGCFTLDSSAQMKSRPIAPLINTLKELGAQFSFLQKDNCFPFTVRGADKINPSLCVDISGSSQFLSALLISAVCAKQPVTIKTSGSHGLDYVNMTLGIMREFGAAIALDNGVYTVSGGYTAREYSIEPDLSAACYFYAANKILGTDIRVNGVDVRSIQGDYKFIELLKSFNGGKIDMSGFSDQALTLAAIAPYLNEPTEICGVEHIRKQECDRINAIVRNLTAMNVRCEERADGVKIYPSQPCAAQIETFGDHRVAMSFAITGLRADGICIKNPEVCSKTFKEYFDVLTGVCEDLIE